jgi:hypothetical protein
MNQYIRICRTPVTSGLLEIWQDNVEVCLSELLVRMRVGLIWLKTGTIDFGNEFSGSAKR